MEELRSWFNGVSTILTLLFNFIRFVIFNLLIVFILVSLNSNWVSYVLLGTYDLFGFFMFLSALGIGFTNKTK